MSTVPRKMADELEGRAAVPGSEPVGRTESGGRRAHPGAPHTTGHAGPHPAVRLASRKRW